MIVLFLRILLLTFLVLLAVPVSNLLAQEEDLTILDDWLEHAGASNALYRDLHRQAREMLAKRRQAVEAIETLGGWQLRQEEIRETLDRVVGPFPERTPLNAMVTGRIELDLIVVEKIVFESQPGFYVTAALFKPREMAGRAPAILYCSGHTENGFRSDTYQTMILNLALKGFVVLAFDPFGQGERQAYLNEEGVSRVGGPTRQHSYPGSQLFLLGQSLAKYAIWDGIRAIDYLVSRPEVDPERIGVTGRSGGGTQAAHIAAFDERIAAAAPEAYITSFDRLLSSIGPQDAEQNFFQGIVSGLDHADLLSVRAPKPALMITTTRDFFSIQGARETFAEVRRIYDAYDAPDAFEMVEDDAPHASTRKNREAMYRFFLHHFSLESDYREADVEVLDPESLRVTTTGQVATSYDAETAFSLMQRDLPERSERIDGEALRRAIREIAGYRRVDAPVDAVFAGRYPRSGYSIEKYLVTGGGDYSLPLLVFTPESAGSHPVLLYLNPEGKASRAAVGGDIERWVRAGYVVVAPDLPGYGELAGDFRGDAYMDGVSLNTWFAGILIGRSITGIQATDISRMAVFANTLPGADASRLVAVAHGTLSDPLLHAASMDASLRAIALLDPLLSYRSLVQSEYFSPRLISSTAAGALSQYDIPQLAASLAPRPLALVRPVDAMEAPASETAVDETLLLVREAYAERGQIATLEIVSGGTGWTMDSWLERVTPYLADN